MLILILILILTAIIIIIKVKKIEVRERGSEHTIISSFAMIWDRFAYPIFPAGYTGPRFCGDLYMS
jgi:hypothetical protein